MKAQKNAFPNWEGAKSGMESVEKGQLDGKERF